MALARAKAHQQEFWERDKKIVREANFKKALLALAEVRKAEQAEKERQAAIAEQRLKNLKKARRVLKRMKQKENDNG